MKRGDEVYFSSIYFDNGERRNTQLKRKTTHFLRIVEVGNPSIIEVSGGSLGTERMLVRETEIELKCIVDKREEAQKQEQARQSYASIIEAWQSGLRTNKEIAEKCGRKAQGISSSIEAAKRWGFIQDDVKTV